MEAVLIGSACGVAYLALHWLWDWTRKNHHKHSVRLSTKKVPEPAVSGDSQEVILRIARALISELIENLWVETRAEAEGWLADYDKSGASSTELLKRAYKLLLKVKTVHDALPSVTEEQARRVSEWLTEYIGEEGGK